MALTVNTNIAAMNAYRNLNKTNDMMNKSLEKLSSGSRINRAADDAAGLAISEGMKSQIGGLKMAVRNTQDGISVVQTAEGALTETTSILQRMRDLSVQAANDAGLNASAKSNIQAEQGQLKSELNRIASTTTFNGAKLLDGTYTGKNFQVGANAGETISVNIATGMDAASLGIAGIDMTAPASGSLVASAALAAGTVAVTAATSAAVASLKIGTSADFGASTGAQAAFGGLNGTISFGGKSLDLKSVDYSNVDNDNNAATTGTAAQWLTALNKAAANAFGVTGAASAGIFTASTSALTLNVSAVTQTGAYGSFATTAGLANSGSAQDAALASPTFTAASGASDALTKIDAAISSVSTTRANLGALQNRFDHTINNLNVAVENLTASNSRIVDTDMAQEMTAFTKAQILSQAGTAMLSQANQAPQGILKLLG